MANLFDSTNYSEIEPTIEEFGRPIVAGDYTAWKRTDLNSDYSTSLYTLTYQARLENAGSTNISLTATESNNEYLIEVSSTASASYTVGIYHWDAFITRDSDSARIRVDSGQWEVIANLASATTDPRSQNKKILDAIVAIIEGRASQDQMSYSIAGRSLSRMSIDDLLQFEGVYKARWLREQRELRNKEVGGNDSIILTRLPT